MSRLSALFGKAALSALLLYLSLRHVNLAIVQQRLGTLDLYWTAAIPLLLCAQMLLLAIRWRLIAEACGAELPPTTALYYTFIGLFFGQVLPSTAGGDAARIWLFARGGAGWRVAVYSVLIDRIVGVSALAVLVVACLPWAFRLIFDPAARAALAIVGFGALGAAIFFLALGVPYLRVLERWWPTRHLAAASRLAWLLCRRVTGIRVAALSFAIHFVTVAMMWAAGMAAHAEVDFLDIFVIILPVLLIATIPVSISGWGLRESTMVLAFSYAGLAQDDGLLISVLYGLANLAVGAIAGMVWVGSGYRRRSVAIVASSALTYNFAAVRSESSIVAHGNRAVE